MPKQTTEASQTLNQTTNPILLDTHVAIWLSDGSSNISTQTLKLIENGFHDGLLCISTISAWEIGLLVSRNRLDLRRQPMSWFIEFVDRFRVNIAELTAEIAISSSYLPGKLHGDPADRMIIATAMAHSAQIVTADKNIVSYGKQGFVKIIAC